MWMASNKGTKEEQEQAHFVTEFIDIYEKKFLPLKGGEIINKKQ